MLYLLVGLGGAVGTLLRFAVSKIAAQWEGPTAWFPAGTFAANLVGSCLLGVLFVWGEGKTLAGVDLRLVLGTGVMGGFTTYSTFNLETLRFLSAGHPGRAAFYALATLLSCLVGGALGIAVGRSLGR